MKLATFTLRELMMATAIVALILAWHRERDAAAFVRYGVEHLRQNPGDEMIGVGGTWREFQVDARIMRRSATVNDVRGLRFGNER